MSKKRKINWGDRPLDKIVRRGSCYTITCIDPIQLCDKKEYIEKETKKEQEDEKV